MTAMSTEAPTDATKELRASVSMGVPRHTLWATPTVAIHAAFTGLPLPCRWNRRIDRGCYDSRPGIRHANRMLATPRDMDKTDKRLRRLLRTQLPLPLDPKRKPQSACTAHTMRPEWESNATALAECAYLVAKQWAREEVRPWHEMYHALPCAASVPNPKTIYQRNQNRSGDVPDVR